MRKAAVVRIKRLFLKRVGRAINQSELRKVKKIYKAASRKGPAARERLLQEMAA